MIGRRIREKTACLLAIVALVTSNEAIHLENRHRAIKSKQRENQERKKQQLAAAAAQPRRPARQKCNAEGECFPLGLQAHVHSPPGSITFCRDCDPSDHGSFADIWRSAFSKPDFDVVGELVYAVPNDASTELLDAIGGVIMLADRGTVSIAAKAQRAQQAGAIALVVIDSKGDCDESFRCGRLGNKPDGDLLAARDMRSAWHGVHIPVVLVSKATGQRLVLQMDVTEEFIHGHGVQLVAT
jgi:hypothetical protein